MELTKLKPISKAEAETIAMQRALQAALGGIPTPTNGTNGRDGKDGKDGVTTTVVQEVLANKEALLEKEEFEAFKKQVMDMENQLNTRLSKTHNYFPGGSPLISDIANVVEVSGVATVEESQLLRDKINIVMVMEAGSVITLPKETPTRIVWVQQGFEGSGTYTIN